MNRFLPILALLLFTGCGGGHQPPPWDAAAVRPKHPWGNYSGQVEARWENDGRHMTLLSELHYTDPDGVVWIAPAGPLVDGAPIPRAFWAFMGGPFTGKTRNAFDAHACPSAHKNR